MKRLNSLVLNYYNNIKKDKKEHSKYVCLISRNFRKMDLGECLSFRKIPKLKHSRNIKKIFKIRHFFSKYRLFHYSSIRNQKLRFSFYNTYPKIRFNGNSNISPNINISKFILYNFKKLSFKTRKGLKLKKKKPKLQALFSDKIIKLYLYHYIFYKRNFFLCFMHFFKRKKFPLAFIMLLTSFFKREGVLFNQHFFMYNNCIILPLGSKFFSNYQKLNFRKASKYFAISLISY